MLIYWYLFLGEEKVYLVETDLSDAEKEVCHEQNVIFVDPDTQRRFCFSKDMYNNEQSYGYFGCNFGKMNGKYWEQPVAASSL